MFWMFNTPPKVTPKQYNLLKKDFIDYSKSSKWITPQLQASLWLTVKRIKHS